MAGMRRMAWDLGPSMTSAAGESLCSHCFLPVGRRPIAGHGERESCAFCCYGCCIAFQVKSGKSEESDAAWLLIRLGVGGFLSMNIMLFSMLLYTGAFTGADAQCASRGSSFCCGSWRRRRCDSRRTLLARDLVQCRSRPFDVVGVDRLGVGAAYAYSALAVFEHGRAGLFDTATMVLMLFTLGRYLEAVRSGQGGARPRTPLWPRKANARLW